MHYFERKTFLHYYGTARDGEHLAQGSTAVQDWLGQAMSISMSNFWEVYPYNTGHKLILQHF